MQNSRTLGLTAALLLTGNRAVGVVANASGHPKRIHLTLSATERSGGALGFEISPTVGDVEVGNWNGRVP